MDNPDAHLYHYEKRVNKMATISYQDTRELKEGIVRIHRHLELRKLRSRLRAKAIRTTNASYNEARIQKQENS